MAPGPVLAPADVLAHRVDGQVLVPGDPGYHRLVERADPLDEGPSAVVVADDVSDVIVTVGFAADHGLPLAARAHPGRAGAPAGVLLVTSHLREVTVDVEARTAWVGAGCSWADVVDVTSAHGLAPVAAAPMAAGVVGSVLDGGLGWLARRHGLSCDVVRSIELVAPDATLLRCCTCENPAVFRDLRGGGSPAPGIVTDLELDLVPLDDVYAGESRYEHRRAVEVLACWAEWVADVPRELTTSVALTADQLGVAVRGCWVGDVDAGRAHLDAWRRTLPPEVHRWRDVPVAELASLDGPAGGGPVVDDVWWRRLGTDAIAAAVRHRRDGRVVEVRHAGGAVADGALADSAFAHRDDRFVLRIVDGGR